MPDGVSVRIEGADDVVRMLGRITDATGPRVLKRGVKAGAEPIIEDARHRVTSERVKRNLKFLGYTVQADGAVIGHAGVPSGDEAFMALWIEKGTPPRVQRTTGRRTGSMPARPFLRPAAMSKRDEAVEEFTQELRRELLKHGGS